MEPPAIESPRVQHKPNAECIACRKPISPNATKCTECDSYQNKYVYYILYGGSLLKPILELAPIFGIAIALWHIAFPGAAEIKLTAECQEKKIFVTAINKGGQIGAIAHPKLYVKRDGKTELSPVQLKPADMKTVTSQILKPGDGVVIEYQGVLHGVENIIFPTKDQSKDCQLEIRYSTLKFAKVARDGDNEAICPCPEYKP